jgi:AraC-like DNA-binding protein
MGRASNRPRILLASLPRGLQEALGVMLRSWFTVDLASTVAEALALAAKAPPALAIVDASVGLDALTVLRNLKGVAPRCVLTLFVSKDDVAAPREIAGFGADAVFSRPITLGEVLERIAALLILHRRTDIKRIPRLSRRVCSAIEVISQQYAQAVRLQNVANEAGLSSAQLRRLLRRELGVGFNEFLTAVRVEIAKRLLHATDDKLSAVARQTGFNDASHLSRQFQKYVGHRPGVWRRRR